MHRLFAKAGCHGLHWNVRCAKILKSEAESFEANLIAERVYFRDKIDQQRRRGSTKDGNLSWPVLVRELEFDIWLARYFGESETKKTARTSLANEDSYFG